MITFIILAWAYIAYMDGREPTMNDLYVMGIIASACCIIKYICSRFYDGEGSFINIKKEYRDD